MSFFSFQQGSDSHSLPPPDSSLRYGRFRAFSPSPSPARRRSIGDLFSAFNTGDPVPPATRRLASGYGTVPVSERGLGDEDDDDDSSDDRWWLDRVLISPRRKVVQHMVERWWRRWAVLVLLPAAITIVWCAVPFPTEPLANPNPPSNSTSTSPISHRPVTKNPASVWHSIEDAVENIFDFSVIWDMINSLIQRLRNSLPHGSPGHPSNGGGTGPGHGESEVALNFWFFLVFYYGFYNLVALLWMTKIFNLYSVNWWPRRLGFPFAFTFFNILPMVVAIILYDVLPGDVITWNLTWIFLTFATMCCPVLIAFLVLLFERRNNHLGRRRGLSETQVFFPYLDDPRQPRRRFRRRKGCGLHLARSYKRFFWFCLAIAISLLAFVLGEVYAELYLRTLPHNSLETVIYVWSWVATIHILDLITGWILGARVGSYPLGWAFKLFFALTYQTYVRALYARLRSPSQFAYLQLLSSSIVVLWSPLTMTRPFHKTLRFLKLNGQNYEEWKKTVGRSFYVRGLAENVSMVAWLGWVIVLHYGYNTKIYPYFAFSENEQNGEGYTFSLTFWWSLWTWVCEVVAGWIVRRAMGWGWKFNVTSEAVGDFVRYPELFPASLLVMVHVLQNMLFSIVRVKFWWT